MDIETIIDDLMVEVEKLKGEIVKLNDYIQELEILNEELKEKVPVLNPVYYWGDVRYGTF